MPNTPLLPLHNRWFSKMESENPTGSMKYRSAFKILTEARLPPGSTVVESTSGNMGVALAQVAKDLGHEVVLVTDPKLSPYHEKKMRELGAQVHPVLQRDETGGWLLTRLAYVQELLADNPTWFWTNQYENPLSPIAFESIGIELLQDLRKVPFYPDTRVWYFSAVSTGGSLSGSARVLRRRFGSLLKVVAVDIEGSAIFGRPPRIRHLNGIGSSIANPANLQRDLIDDVVIVTDAEAIDACLGAGSIGGSSGAVWAAVKKRVDQIQPHDIVIALFPDAGYIYNQTIYSREWRKQRMLP